MNSVAPSLRAERLERRAERSRQTPRALRATIGLHGRPGKVRRQIHRGQPCIQSCLPIVQLRRQRRTAQLTLLPRGKVGVAHPQRWQIRGGPGHQAIVQLAELAIKNHQRRGIANDVMKIQQKNKLLLFQLEQVGAHQRRVSERMRLPRILRDQLFGFCPGFSLRSSAPVDDSQTERRGWHDLLDRCAVDLDEDGAQTLMALDHRAERSFERNDIQRAMDPVNFGHVVGRETRLDLVQKPEPPLGEGQRNLPIPWGRRERRDHAATLVLPQLLDKLSQTSDGRQFK